MELENYLDRDFTANSLCRRFLIAGLYPYIDCKYLKIEGRMDVVCFLLFLFNLNQFTKRRTYCSYTCSTLSNLLFGIQSYAFKNCLGLLLGAARGPRSPESTPLTPRPSKYIEKGSGRCT